MLLLLYFWWRTVRQLPLADTMAEVRGNEAWLVLALLAAGLYLVGQAVLWRVIVADLVVRIPWPVALRAWMLSNMARYLPGAVWHLVGRVEMGKVAGVTRASGGLGVALEQGLLLLGALGIVAASLPFWPATSVVRQWAWLALLVPAGLVAMHPRVYFPLLNWGLVRLGRAPLPPSLGYRQLLRYALAYVGVHLCNGLALAFSAVALGAPLTVIPAMVGAALFAWTVGYLWVLAPGGLGVREVLVTAALTPLVGGEIAAVAALLWRAANVLTELAGAAAFEGVWRLWRRRST